MYLSKKYKDEEILVKFDCQSETKMDDDPNEEQDRAGEDGEEREPNYGVDFQVLIRKDDSQVIVQCIAGKELTVTHAYCLPLGKSADDVLLYAGRCMYVRMCVHIHQHR